MLNLLFMIAAMNSTASADPGIRCGGAYGPEELRFEQNPINGVWSAHTKDDTFVAYVDATRGEKLRIVTAEVVSDSQWEKLKLIRDSSKEPDLQQLLSRLGSTKVLDMWIGWTSDGYVHFEGAQREAKFTFSCKR